MMTCVTDLFTKDLHYHPLIYSAKWPIVFCDIDGHEDGNTGTQKSGKDSKSNSNEAAQVVSCEMMVYCIFPFFMFSLSDVAQYTMTPLQVYNMVLTALA